MALRRFGTVRPRVQIPGPDHVEFKSATSLATRVTARSQMSGKLALTDSVGETRVLSRQWSRELRAITLLHSRSREEPSGEGLRESSGKRGDAEQNCCHGVGSPIPRCTSRMAARWGVISS